MFYNGLTKGGSILENITVRDLIATLESLDQELPVKIVACDDGEHVVEGYISKCDVGEDVDFRNNQKIAKISYIA